MNNFKKKWFDWEHYFDSKKVVEDLFIKSRGLLNLSEAFYLYTNFDDDVLNYLFKQSINKQKEIIKLLKKNKNYTIDDLKILELGFRNKEDYDDFVEGLIIDDKQLKILSEYLVIEKKYNVSREFLRAAFFENIPPELIEEMLYIMYKKKD